MQSLQEKAFEWSGVDPADAFAIDSTNLYQKLGLQTFINLSTDFYTRVYEDEEEWFRSIFANSKKEEAIQNQYEFFVQRMGGPPLYSQRKGLLLHSIFLIFFFYLLIFDFQWFQILRNIVSSSSWINAVNYNMLRHTAFFLVAGDQLKNQNHQPQCKHEASKPAAV
ncbi:hypothetical protein JRO89_XS03G0266400 [Xanthoceras sorbifolium]|uniref:Uncharacterized protein n=1 Tax=Xanthoceras sorbifolium TaxID=99658 RepID=A0ABQ8IC71_9ROSI|nr:hypothetical protein JRO89_XS03G0266400 [Xanthoceras sorbifolium]